MKLNPEKFETDWEPDEAVAQPATLAVEKEVDDEGTGSTDRPAADG